MSRITTVLHDILDRVEKGQVLFSARLIASFIGQIISCKSVLGNLVRLKTRFLYFCVETRASWCSRIKLTQDAISELRFWRESVYSLNEGGTKFKSVSISEIFDFELFSDASDSGYGGYVIQPNGNSEFQTVSGASGQQGQRQIPQTESGHDLEEGQTVSGVWSRFETEKSSTWRELESIYRVIHSKSDDLSNSTVKVVSDNENVSHILHVGSKKSDLQDFCGQHSRSMRAKSYIDSTGMGTEASKQGC